MGDVDIYLKNFIKIDSIFAQLFSQGVFDGKLVIDPNRLKELDTVNQETVQVAEGQLKSLERLRDVQKIGMVFEDKVHFQVILGVEGQSGVNYYMPVRCMELDALAYTYQCRKISEQAKEDKKLKKYADGVPKGTKIIPTITLVLYYGSRAWDGPVSVYDMLDIPEEMKECLNHTTPDYRMNLIDVRHMRDEEIEKFKGDLKAFFIMLNEHYNAEKLKSIVAVHRETWYTVGAIKKDMRYMEYINHVSEEELKGGLMMDATLDFIEARGMAKGETNGINKVNQLVLLLSKDGRLSDILKSAEDREYQKQLFVEYGLEDAPQP